MLPILIAGGGIGGLASAIALAQHGISSHILERRTSFSEAGAGIQIGPNGVRVLEELGVADILRPKVGVPDYLNVFNGVSGRSLAQFPMGEWIAKRHGAPYWTAHRRDLQEALLRKVRSLELVTISNGFTVETLRDVESVVKQNSNAGSGNNQPCVEVVSDEGQVVTGRALIAADGLWSKVRARLFQAPPPRFAGHIAARAVIPTKGLGDVFAGGQTGIWLAPKSHVVHYPVAAGTQVAVVVIIDIAGDLGVSGKAGSHGSVQTDDRFKSWQGWDMPVAIDAFKAHFKTAPPLLRAYLGQIKDWQQWALYDPPPLPCWCAGRFALLGDAAHPILPYFAQGAAMALEDAVTIAATLASKLSDPAGAFSDYEALRRERVAKVQAASRSNGNIYHQEPPLSYARDMALRLVPGARMMQRYDWLYGWRLPNSSLHGALPQTPPKD